MGFKDKFIHLFMYVTRLRAQSARERFFDALLLTSGAIASMFFTFIGVPVFIQIFWTIVFFGATITGIYIDKELCKFWDKHGGK